MMANNAKHKHMAFMGLIYCKSIRHSGFGLTIALPALPSLGQMYHVPRAVCSLLKAIG